MFKLIQVLSIFIFLAAMGIGLSIIWWVFKAFLLIFGYGLISILVLSGLVYLIIKGFWALISSN